jgi:hypothetical protein
MSKVDRGVYAFEVKDGHVVEGGSYAGNEEAYIYCQPTESELGIVGRGHLSIHVRPGTSHVKVRDLARTLHDLGATISYSPQ